jgi:hypothetical protein
VGNHVKIIINSCRAMLEEKEENQDTIEPGMDSEARIKR